MNFESKYGIEEDEEIKQFHKSRIMFAIVNGELFISEQTENSHAEWFKELGWITDADDSIINIIVRGCVDHSGVYFYRGYDFIADEKDESVFLSNLKELHKRLKLDLDLSVYAGVIKLPDVKRFPPRKKLGSVFELLMDK